MEMLDKFRPLWVDASSNNFDYFSTGIFATSTGSYSNTEADLCTYYLFKVIVSI